MTPKPLLIALAVLALVLFGAYAKGVYDEAGQADLLRRQIAATAERIDRQTAVARQAEADLLAARQTLAALNRKWTATRAQKNRTPCRLDADTLGVLRDATAGDAPAR